jgi:glucosamine--fructose-6-phosphate aminotransferase (isomerizing)
MKTNRLLEDILHQPESLQRMADYQFGEGRAALNRAADLLRGASRVILSGMGSSLCACIPLEHYLGTHGIPVTTIDAGELLHFRQRACHGAVTVLVSQSGDTIEIAKLLPLLKAQGATVIGVTNKPEGRLAREADHIMFIGSRPDKGVALQTYVCTLASLLLLGAAVANELGEQWRRDLDHLAEAFSSALQRSLPESEQWRPFFERASLIYLLARGPSFASALEASILFNEVTKFPAVAKTAGSFRHGHIEVADPDFRGVVFASQECTREIDLGLARDLTSFGGQVRVVAPAGKESGNDDLSYWLTPSTAEILAPVLEIIPLQVASYQLARWRNVPPGEFRNVGPVILTENQFKRVR